MLIAIQILVLLLLIALSAFFAGSETGVYRISRFRLRLDIERSTPFASLLGKVMADSHALVFSLLVGNNLVNYLVTSLAILILLSSPLDENPEFYATLIITPTLFVFAEVVPKNIYYRHANTLMSYFAPLLWFFHMLFTYSGVIFLLKSFSRFFASILPLPIDPSDAIESRGKSHISQIIRETHDEGILSSLQIDLMNRLVKINSIVTRSVMTPVSRVEMVSIDTSRTDLLEKLSRCPYTRLPVYEKSRNNVTGFINVYHALASDRDFTDLRQFIKPIRTLPAAMKIIEAINTLKTESCKIVLIKQTNRRNPLGIITMKDLVEELTGELQQW